jgi:hypothetical protein
VTSGALTKRTSDCRADVPGIGRPPTSVDDRRSLPIPEETAQERRRCLAGDEVLPIHPTAFGEAIDATAEPTCRASRRDEFVPSARCHGENRIPSGQLLEVLGCDAPVRHERSVELAGKPVERTLGQPHTALLAQGQPRVRVAPSALRMILGGEE